MPARSQVQRRFCVVVLLAAFAGGIGVVSNGLKPPPDEWMFVSTNNPDKFYLWGSTTNFQHAFTYDPHAADGWLFEWGNAPRARQASSQ